MNYQRTNSFRISILFSLLLHTLPFLLLLLLGGGGGGKDKGKGGGNHAQQEKNDIIPKDSNEPVDVEIVHDVGRFKKKPKPAHAEDKCKNFFGGIGITISFLYDNQVMSALPGYPASSAGIAAGDRVLCDTEIKGTIGTRVTVTVIKPTGEVKTLTLIRDKICVEKEIKESP